MALTLFPEKTFLHKFVYPCVNYVILRAVKNRIFPVKLHDGRYLPVKQYFGYAAHSKQATDFTTLRRRHDFDGRASLF